MYDILFECEINVYVFCFVTDKHFISLYKSLNETSVYRS